MIGAVWTVLRKELLDALRDRRTLLMVLLSSVAMGPLVLLLLSKVATGAEERAQAREIVAVGIERAPTLRNYLERQTLHIRVAPPDYEARLRDGRLADPVLVVGADFEARLAHGEPAPVQIVGNSADLRSEGGQDRLAALLQGFNHEQATLRLAWRGVAPGLLEALRVDERDLADPAARTAQTTALLPFFVLMAVVYGSLHAALDTTAGERERGSLEPLLMNPQPRLALVLGKWAAVAVLGLAIAALCAFSFLPGQWLLDSESLAALFQFGPSEALEFVALLAPLAGAVAAVLMAVAIRCRSYKEAQASASVVVLLVSLLPLARLLQQQGEARWQFWVPGLAQITLMSQVLEGRALTLAQALPAAAVCAATAAAALAYVARVLGRSALD
ncbi:MAG: ABC transporter permease [Burkholderiales bacterium]|nr:ABC transporter permease [Burkholderiales bacterium]MDE2452067.1 ABC transporter permease [Burkholderiales bacterium]